MSSPATVVFVALAAACAVGDWVTVARASRLGERILKAATLALLVAAAATAELGSEKPWVVTALACGLAGDVGLLLTRDDGDLDGWFLGGLGAFLVGHAFWMTAFVSRGVHPVQALAGVLIALGIAGLVLPSVLRAVHASDGLPLTLLVAGYTAALAAMAVLAVATGIVAVAVGGVAFLVSDAVLARDRFVAPVKHGHLIVMITYHLAQFLLLLGLIHGGL